MMESHEVTRIQAELSDAIGVRVSDGDLGDAMGLEPKNSAAAVRKWKSSGPTGPAAMALSYLAQGLPNGKGLAQTPEFVIGPSLSCRESLYIVRLHFPRFVGLIVGPDFPTIRTQGFRINGQLSLMVQQWIDAPALASFNEHDRRELIGTVCREIDAELSRRERE